MYITRLILWLCCSHKLPMVERMWWCDYLYVLQLYSNITSKNNVLLAWVSDKCRQLATSKRFGRDKYLLCLNCFSNSSNCCDVNAVRGRRVLPSIACCMWRPPVRNNWTYKTCVINKSYHILYYYCASTWQVCIQYCCRKIGAATLTFARVCSLQHRCGFLDSLIASIFPARTLDPYPHRPPAPVQTACVPGEFDLITSLSHPTEPRADRSCDAHSALCLCLSH